MSNSVSKATATLLVWATIMSHLDNPYSLLADILVGEADIEINH